MTGEKSKQPPRQSLRRLILVILLLIGVGVLGWRRLGPLFFKTTPAPGAAPVPAPAPLGTNVALVPAGTAGSKGARADGGNGRSEQGAGEKARALAQSLREWRPGADAAATQAGLEELRRKLRGAPAGEAVSAIRGYLDGKGDVVTGLEIKVGANGGLVTAPSMRTFLLDELGQIDPAAAALYARTILASMDSPDEWAIALRNLARGEPTADGQLLAGQKFSEMVGNEAWRAQPSVGFLEAFDVAVYLGGNSLVPTLTELVRLKDNQAVAHASYLALDRLTLADPAGTLGALAANPESMAGREVTRANYFARADVRDDAQRQVLEGYLLNPALSGEELDKFAGLYPSANFMVSHNLLTRSETPDHAWLVARDREALEQVRRWLQDARFAQRQAALRSIERRLAEFVSAGSPNQR
jgi:hypothetical protein